MWSRRKPVGRESLSPHGTRRGTEPCVGIQGPSNSLTMMGRGAWQELGKGSLPWMGGCYQQSSAGTKTTQHWPKEQVSRVSHICGLLENALETETSKAKDEESGPWIPLSLGLSFRGFVCMGYVSIFKAPRPRSNSPVKPSKAPLETLRMTRLFI